MMILHFAFCILLIIILFVSSIRRSLRYHAPQQVHPPTDDTFDSDGGDEDEAGTDDDEDDDVDDDDDGDNDAGDDDKYDDDDENDKLDEEISTHPVPHSHGVGQMSPRIPEHIASLCYLGDEMITTTDIQ